MNGKAFSGDYHSLTAYVSLSGGVSLWQTDKRRQEYTNVPELKWMRLLVIIQANRSFT